MNPSTSNKKRKFIVNIGLIVLGFLLLFATMQNNLLHSMNEQRFKNFQFDSESLVVGKLIETRHQGIFSYGGQLGRYLDPAGEFNAPKVWSQQTEIYLGGKVTSKFKPYTSQIGLQGIAFSALDTFLSRGNFLTPAHRLGFYHGLNVSFLAIILLLILALFHREFGLGACIVVFVFILLSQWLTVFGRNLYWVSWTFYLPFLWTFWAHKKEEKQGQFSLIFMGLGLMFLIALKCACGYEYITTITLAACCPSVYFSFKNNGSWGTLLKRLLLLCGFALLGFFIAFSLHVLQQAMVNHLSFFEAIKMQFDHALSRLYVEAPKGNPQSYWYLGAKASTFDVLKLYWNASAISFRSFGIPKAIKFKYAILFFLAVSFLALSLRSGVFARHRPKVVALVVTVWFSALGPLLWFIPAKVHSYVHAQINEILLYLPLMLFGFALVGFVSSLVTLSILKKQKMRFYVSRELRLFSFFVLVCLGLFSSWSFLS